jgi:hypothetical protein
METNAKSLVDHWTWAADKGVLNRNTAAGLRSACTRVLAVLGDDWEETDISRFGCREPRQTFREAVASCLEYLRDPGGWEPATQERAAAPQRSDRSRKLPSTTTTLGAVTTANRAGPGEIEYPFPLRPGVMARLVLPSNLTQQDVSRLTAFMAMLVVGVERQQPASGDSDEQ